MSQISDEKGWVPSVSKSDDENNRQHRRFTTKGQVGAWVVYFVLILSIQSCESFTSRSPGLHSISTKSKPTILRLVETEAPTIPTEERAIGFQPSIPEHSILCEQESVQEGSPADSSNQNDNEEEATETRAESDSTSESEYDDDEDIEKQGRLVPLANRKSRVKQNTRAKGTSVGARRMGVASKARRGAGTMTRLTDAVRRSASANKGKKKQDTDDGTLWSKLTQSSIHSAVGDMMTSSKPSMVVLSRASVPHLDLTAIQTTPPPGTILIDSPKNNRWKASDRVSVRVATQNDDLNIADLRLSVFSNFSADMRQSFCSRSCHVLAMRRNQGATCIVATVPRYGSILSNKKGIILGTAECSIHEFFGTRLGSHRQQCSILYITEVAVSPTARRKGIGAKIMQSIDELARIRNVETLYLHVEVTNDQALNLYENAGFERLSYDEQMYYEFTRSLGLHDGALKGRKHYLMCKNIQDSTWVPAPETQVSQRGTLGIEMSA